MKTDFLERQKRIRFIKTSFTAALSDALNLHEVQAPMLTDPRQGVQDNLAGTEQAVQVNVRSLPGQYEVVHSLAKWKRATLARYEFSENEGLVAQMKALRPDEAQLTPLHSVQVDQWDWEQVIAPEHRSRAKLEQTVQQIYGAIQRTASELAAEFHEPPHQLPKRVTFIHAESLLARYPRLTAKQREREAAKRYGAVFLIGIGGKLANGYAHDVRAPDYDDWSSMDEQGERGLNGDLLVWNPILDDVIELSSMGIRVDATSLERQVNEAGCAQYLQQPWHQQLLQGHFPASIGGGIGQSRLCMWLLQLPHIGYVQSSVWAATTHQEHPLLL